MKPANSTSLLVLKSLNVCTSFSAVIISDYVSKVLIPTLDNPFNNSLKEQYFKSPCPPPPPPKKYTIVVLLTKNCCHKHDNNKSI